MVPSRTKLGKYLRKQRLKFPYKQEEVAELTGIPQPTLSALEIGKRKFLLSGEAELLAPVLECSVTELRLFEKPENVKNKKAKLKPTTAAGKFIKSQAVELGLDPVRNSFLGRVILSPKPCISYSKMKRLCKILRLKPVVFKKFLAPNAKKTKGKLGHLVRFDREERGWSQDDLALKLGKTRAYVSAVERGRVRHTTDKQPLRDLAKAFRKPVTPFYEAGGFAKPPAPKLTSKRVSLLFLANF